MPVRMSIGVTGAAVAACALVITGCATISGPKAALLSTGPADTTSAAGPARTFIEREAAARTAASAATHATGLLMLTSGMSLARANCLDYFGSMGNEQRNLIVSRQVVNAVGALAATLMLMERVDPDSITLVELGQGAANTGLDIYTQNYLFAAENVETVRALVFQAMDVHAQGALALGPFDYWKASDLILEHQNICRPRPIADLVLKAIRAGNVSVDPAIGGANTLEATRDRAAGRRLAELFGQPGMLSEDQIGALWWLLMDYSTLTTRKTVIAPLLGDLAPKVLADGALVLSPSQQEDVRRGLQMFSPPHQAALATTASEAQRGAEAAERRAAELAKTAAALPNPDLQRFLSQLTGAERLQLNALGEIDEREGFKLFQPGAVPSVSALVPTVPLPSFVPPSYGASNARSVPLRVD